jgi:UDP-N-acetylglucosamine enolpyruvyl transferase
MVDSNTETKMRTSLLDRWRPNAAREPEIADLVRCLMAMGARVTGLDSNVLTAPTQLSWEPT